jgi:hypothetical protein
MALRSIIDALGEASKNKNQMSFDLASQARFNILSLVLFLASAGTGILIAKSADNPVFAIVGIALGVILAQSPKVAKQWERAVILRFGKYVGLRGPGIFWIVPFMDSINAS